MTPSQVPRLGLFANSARSPACSQQWTVPLAWFPYDRYYRLQWLEG